MARLNRQLQVLIDEERWQLLRREAERSGAPIGAIVRKAIDEALPAGSDRTSVEAAARRLLDAEPMPVEDWGRNEARHAG
jgi:hypothetical protein